MRVELHNLCNRCLTHLTKKLFTHTMFDKLEMYCPNCRENIHPKDIQVIPHRVLEFEDYKNLLLLGITLLNSLLLFCCMIYYLIK